MATATADGLPVDGEGLLIVVSGPPGAGKTTVAGELARTYDRAVHLRTDDFWRSIVSGGIAPFEPRADRQNHVVLDVVAGAAYGYAAGGFVTVVDGVVGPWMLRHFREASGRHPGVPLHYVVLRPRREVTWGRARARTASDALTDEVPVLAMWDAFADLGGLETHVLDTSDQTAGASVRAIADGTRSGRFLLRPEA